MDNLNCKMQAHARVCEENKLEELELEEKIRCLLKQFHSKRCDFDGSYKKNGETYQDDILKDDSP